MDHATEGEMEGNPITDQTKQFLNQQMAKKKVYQRNEGIQHPRGSCDECKGKRHAPGRKPTKKKRQKAEGGMEGFGNMEGRSDLPGRSS